MSQMIALSNAVLAPGLCAFTMPIEIGRPRTVLSVGTSDLLALERDSESVVFLFDSDGDGIPDSKRTLASEDDLNHGLALYDRYIYASSDKTVYRWLLEDDEFTSVGEVEVVIFNINADGNGGAPQGHRTRTLAIDDSGQLYVSVGSNENVDEDSYRSRIRRFDLDETLPIDFQNGEIFADGLRNEVGLAFDKFGVLWGVENGADRLERNDLGGDIHNDNPGEELNRFLEEDAGKHWGYPYCWSEFNLPGTVGRGPGTAWAWPSFLENVDVTDEQCRQDYMAPIVSMQAHSAPLGITFYEWKEELPAECQSAPFPQSMDGYAFIAFHGSWNRDIPTGYKVVYVAFDSDGNAIGDPVDLLAHEPPSANWEDGFRPVDVDFDACGRLIVSSDGTRGKGDKIVRLEASVCLTSALSASPAPTYTAKEPTGNPTVVNPTTKGPTGIPAVAATNTPTDTEESTKAPTVSDETCPCFPTTSPASSGESRIPTRGTILILSTVLLWTSHIN